MPTAAELAGAPVPPNTDGISFLPTLLGRPEAQKQHDFLYWEFHERGFEQAVLVRDGNWKAVRHAPTQPLELYNLNTDIGEKANVAADHPDVIARVMRYLETARTDSAEFPVTTRPAR
jgi:arylsulfatase A-like enzyme